MKRGKEKRVYWLVSVLANKRKEEEKSNYYFY